MPPTAYPSTPIPTRYTVVAPVYAVTESPAYMDGAKDYNLDSETPVRRWILEYETMTTTEADSIDDHYDSCFGEALGFDFTDRESGDTYSDVHYEKLERSRKKSWLQVRRVTLVRYP